MTQGEAAPSSSKGNDQAEAAERLKSMRVPAWAVRDTETIELLQGVTRVDTKDSRTLSVEETLGQEYVAD